MTVNPRGEEETPDPDAEETDVFLVLSADRRARKAREEQERQEEPEPSEEDSPLYRGVSMFAPESEETPTTSEVTDPVRPEADAAPVEDPPAVRADPHATDTRPAQPDTDAERLSPAWETAPPASDSPPQPPVPPEAGPPAPGPSETDTDTGARAGHQAVSGDQQPTPTGFPEPPAVPDPGTEQPEPDRGVLRTEGRLDVPPTGAAPPVSQAPEGIESWIDAVGDGHAPVHGGYEQRIAAVKRIPASPWRRAVFAVTGGRLNLG